MAVVGMAQNVSVQTFNPVNKTVFEQKLNRPVGGGRFGVVHFLGEFGQNIIRPDWLWRGCYNFKHKPPRVGQAVPFGFAKLFQIFNGGGCGHEAILPPRAGKNNEPVQN